MRQKKWVWLVIVLIGLALKPIHDLWVNDQVFVDEVDSSQSTLNTLPNPALWTAYHNKAVKKQVKGTGIITHILKDDLKGSKHQRIILRVNPKQTVLVAHNISLAPRVKQLKVGAELAFYGEYSWNNQGGIVHWTHKDPNKKHRDGWLNYQGQYYQ